MLHSKEIMDADKFYEIDPSTRKIKNGDSKKVSVVQYDHNSERISFMIPRNIEGHDMMTCNKVEVHYKCEDSRGLYEVKDLTVSETDETKLCFSWLLSQNATKNVGNLLFLIRFSCVDEDGAIIYAWNTGIFSELSVTTGMYNTDIIIEQSADALEQWKAEIEELLQAGEVSQNQIFIINAKVDYDNVFSHDLKSFDELVEAYDSGKTLILQLHQEETGVFYELHLVSKTLDSLTKYATFVFANTVGNCNDIVVDFSYHPDAEGNLSSTCSNIYYYNASQIDNKLKTDTVPTENSTKLITSGGVYEALKSNTAFFEVQAYPDKENKDGNSCSTYVLSDDVDAAQLYRDLRKAYDNGKCISFVLRVTYDGYSIHYNMQITEIDRVTFMFQLECLNFGRGISMMIGDNFVEIADTKLITNEEFNAAIGNVETALDNIIDIQNSLIGGLSV